VIVGIIGLNVFYLVLLYFYPAPDSRQIVSGPQTARNAIATLGWATARELVRVGFRSGGRQVSRRRERAQQMGSALEVGALRRLIPHHDAS
jgi:hypothetical protein